LELVAENMKRTTLAAWWGDPLGTHYPLEPCFQRLNAGNLQSSLPQFRIVASPVKSIGKREELFRVAG